MSADKVPAIGIDIGTSYSRVGVFKNGELKIIADEQGKPCIPSCIAFTDNGFLVGEEAVDQFAANPCNNIFGAKSLIGRYFNKCPEQAYAKHVPFTVVDNNDGEAGIKVNFKKQTRIFLPEEVLALIILKLKQMAEAHLGSRVSEAVISVPSGFDSSQRQAIKDAASIAGLQVLRLMNESSAAAVAYGFINRINVEDNVMIFNLGGGSLHTSIISIENGIFEVRSYASDLHLGGDDFDRRLVNHFVNDFKHKYKKDLTCDKLAMQRLRAACEAAKRRLSTSLDATIEIESLHEGIDFRTSISRACFEELCADLFRTALATVEKALRDARLDKSEISNVVLAGGSTIVPKIRSLLQDFFNGKELTTLCDPDGAVVTGTAILAAILCHDNSEDLKELLLLDVVPLYLGI